VRYSAANAEGAGAASAAKKGVDVFLRVCWKSDNRITP
jgi:hypothetical protein